jgi:hypothetical protein
MLDRIVESVIVWRYVDVGDRNQASPAESPLRARVNARHCDRQIPR